MIRWTRAAFVVVTLLAGSLFVAVPSASASYTASCFWNSWPGSNGWAELPNEGRADEMCNFTLSPLYHFHTVWVLVNGHDAYSSAYDTYTHKWKPWPCEPTAFASCSPERRCGRPGNSVGPRSTPG